MKRTTGEKIFQVFNVIFLTLVSFLFIYPFWFVIISSVSDPQLMRLHDGVMMLPQGFTTKGYEMVFRNPNIYTGYKNTLIYVIFGTLISMTLTTMGAYVLSRQNFMLRNFIMVIVTITMFFGGGLIPTFLLINNLKMIDTQWALLIPGAISTYNLIVMRTSFQGIPAELEESARIDGANDFRILWSIVLPVSKAVLAVIALFYAVGTWNSWFSASIYLRSPKYFPLQLILRDILLKSNTSVNAQNLGTEALKSIDQSDVYFKELVQYSTIVISTLPILCIYPFVQKYFVKGVMIGSLKG